MKKLTSMLLVFALAASIVFAGGSGEAASSDSGKVKLTFFETMTSPARTQYIQEMIDRYEAENPNIEIELISPPYEQSDSKLTMTLNSNQPLDIIETRDYTLKQFVNNGWLRDLSGYIDSWEEKDNLLPLTLDAARTVDDIPYLMPQFFYVKALLVRTEHARSSHPRATASTDTRCAASRTSSRSSTSSSQAT